MWNDLGDSHSFDMFLKRKIEEGLKKQRILPFYVGMFDGIEMARTAPANSIDTKLCW